MNNLYVNKINEFSSIDSSKFFLVKLYSLIFINSTGLSNSQGRIKSRNYFSSNYYFLYNSVHFTSYSRKMNKLKLTEFFSSKYNEKSDFGLIYKSKKQIGFGKLTWYWVFKLMQNNRFLLNFKEYRNKLAISKFSFYELALRSYEKNYNNWLYYANKTNDNVNTVSLKKKSRLVFQQYSAIGRDYDEFEIYKDPSIDFWKRVRRAPFTFKYRMGNRAHRKPKLKTAPSLRFLRKKSKKIEEVAEVSKNFWVPFIAKRSIRINKYVKYWEKRMQRSLWKMRTAKNDYVSTTSETFTRINHLNNNLSSETKPTILRNYKVSESKQKHYINFKYRLPINSVELNLGYNYYTTFSTGDSTVKNIGKDRKVLRGSLDPLFKKNIVRSKKKDASLSTKEIFSYNVVTPSFSKAKLMLKKNKQINKNCKHFNSPKTIKKTINFCNVFSTNFGRPALVNSTHSYKKSIKLKKRSRKKVKSILTSLKFFFYYKSKISTNRFIFNSKISYFNFRFLLNKVRLDHLITNSFMNNFLISDALYLVGSVKKNRLSVAKQALLFKMFGKMRNRDYLDSFEKFEGAYVPVPETSEDSDKKQNKDFLEKRVVFSFKNFLIVKSSSNREETSLERFKRYLLSKKKSQKNNYFSFQKKDIENKKQDVVINNYYNKEQENSKFTIWDSYVKENFNNFTYIPGIVSTRFEKNKKALESRTTKELGTNFSTALKLEPLPWYLLKDRLGHVVKKYHRRSLLFFIRKRRKLYLSKYPYTKMSTYFFEKNVKSIPALSLKKSRSLQSRLVSEKRLGFFTKDRSNYSDFLRVTSISFKKINKKNISDANSSLVSDYPIKSLYSTKEMRFLSKKKIFMQKRTYLYKFRPRFKKKYKTYYVKTRPIWIACNKRVDHTTLYEKNTLGLKPEDFFAEAKKKERLGKKVVILGKDEFKKKLLLGDIKKLATLKLSHKFFKVNLVRKKKNYYFGRYKYTNAYFFRFLVNPSNSKKCKVFWKKKFFFKISYKKFWQKKNSSSHAPIWKVGRTRWLVSQKDPVKDSFFTLRRDWPYFKSAKYSKSRLNRLFFKSGILDRKTSTNKVPNNRVFACRKYKNKNFINYFFKTNSNLPNYLNSWSLLNNQYSNFLEPLSIKNSNHLELKYTKRIYAFSKPKTTFQMRESKRLLFFRKKNTRVLFKDRSLKNLNKKIFENNKFITSKYKRSNFLNFAEKSEDFYRLNFYEKAIKPALSKITFASELNQVQKRSLISSRLLVGMYRPNFIGLSSLNDLLLKNIKNAANVDYLNFFRYSDNVWKSKNLKKYNEVYSEKRKINYRYFLFFYFLTEDSTLEYRNELGNYKILERSVGRFNGNFLFKEKLLVNDVWRSQYMSSNLKTDLGFGSMLKYNFTKHSFRERGFVTFSQKAEKALRSSMRVNLKFLLKKKMYNFNIFKRFFKNKFKWKWKQLYKKSKKSVFSLKRRLWDSIKKNFTYKTMDKGFSFIGKRLVRRLKKRIFKRKKIFWTQKRFIYYDSRWKLFGYFWSKLSESLHELDSDYRKATFKIRWNRIKPKTYFKKERQYLWKLKNPFYWRKYKQYAKRFYPKFWYKVHRRKFPLKRHRMDWALKFGKMFSFSQNRYRRRKYTFFDSSSVYYKNLSIGTKPKRHKHYNNYQKKFKMQYIDRDLEIFDFEKDPKFRRKAYTKPPVNVKFWKQVVGFREFKNSNILTTSWIFSPSLTSTSLSKIDKKKIDQVDAKMYRIFSKRKSNLIAGKLSNQSVFLDLLKRKLDNHYIARRLGYVKKNWLETKSVSDSLFDKNQTYFKNCKNYAIVVKNLTYHRIISKTEVLKAFGYESVSEFNNLSYSLDFARSDQRMWNTSVTRSQIRNYVNMLYVNTSKYWYPMVEKSHKPHKVSNHLGVITLTSVRGGFSKDFRASLTPKASYKNIDFLFNLSDGTVQFKNKYSGFYKKNMWMFNTFFTSEYHNQCSSFM